MKVGRQKASENRQKISKAAGRLFRERGFDGVIVAEIMQAAGLTHGGFYGDFKSQEDLIASAVQDARSRAAAPSGDLAAHAAEHLAPTHRDNPARRGARRRSGGSPPGRDRQRGGHGQRPRPFASER